MHSQRDTHLGLGVRQQNWLRLEHWRRVQVLATLLRRALLRSLIRDAGVSARQKVRARGRYSDLSRSGALTKHTTRCMASGRSHHALRSLQMARMHLRQHMAEGRLPGYCLGRR